jgi:hypothetical protein
MSNKVVKGIVNCGREGCTVETDGIHRESELIVSFPVNRVTLFVNEGYLGLFDLCARGIFHFSHTDIKYEYYVGSKTLKVIFDSDQI